MNGDFAFAVWDRRERELFLARDRFGVRPLFVAELGGDLVFASEQKAILRHPAARRELDPAGLVESFTTWCISPDASSFPGIRELAPAHYLRAGPEGIREERRWWDLRFSDAPDVPPAQRAALAEELDALLADATRLRLRADVPVAAYLSGGLDSSAIVAHALEQMDETLYAFGIGFEDPRFDESAYQDLLTGARGLSLTRDRSARATSPSCSRRRSSWRRSRRSAPRRRRSCASPAPCRTPGSRWSRPARAPTSSSAATTSSARTPSATSGPGSPSRSCARSSSRG